MDSKKPKKIIEGFQEDLRTILNEFKVYSPDLYLESFLQYWKNKRLDLLFANRFDPRELLESILEINKELVAIVTDAQGQNIEFRLVTLYMLVCLFMKQPERFRQKIRLTPGDAVELQRFCTIIEREKGHKDATFAWQYLRKVHAIDFVEDHIIYGPSLLIRRGASLHDSTANKTNNEPSVSRTDPALDQREDSIRFFRNKIEPIISEFETVYDGYDKAKEAVKLHEVNYDPSGCHSNVSVRDYMERAKALLEKYKADI